MKYNLKKIALVPVGGEKGFSQTNSREIRVDVLFFLCFDQIFVICDVGQQSSPLVTACTNIDLVPGNQWPVCNPAVDTTALRKYKSNIVKLTRLLCLWFGLACIIAEQSDRCCSYVFIFIFPAGRRHLRTCWFRFSQQPDRVLVQRR